eukprot:TRINITY_DN22855_c0_g1_i2.p1 TRINITY_DN22855_c0_g1~~TRINITY_DN22855_c0_g1_i2.p1  ORF type:complete len:483 (-),score=46.11 TRINITY_DN22855_c0_g1_i2:233-1540(-)
MGVQFLNPVILPYGKMLGASLEVVAFSATCRGIGQMASNVWMPWLSDRKSRKLAITISLLGSSIGYAIEGLASCVGASAITVFLCGRVVGGFFSGTMPVLRAYVTELYVPDENLVRQKLTYLLVADKATRIILAPIAGLLSTLSLSLPFFVCTAVGIFTLIIASSAFREAADIKGTNAKKRSDDSSRDKVSCSDVDSPSPWFDGVVLALLFMYLFVFVAVMGKMFLLPVLLHEPRFGIQKNMTAIALPGLNGSEDLSPSPREVAGKIAKVNGIITMVGGICHVFSAVVIYGKLVPRVGEAWLAFICGCIWSVVLALSAWASAVWQLGLLEAVGQFCVGLIIPTVGPLLGKYANTYFHSRMAQVQGIPVLGISLSTAFGQLIAASVLKYSGAEVAWIVIGCSSFLGITMLLIAVRLVSLRVPAVGKHASEKKSKLL